MGEKKTTHFMTRMICYNAVQIKRRKEAATPLIYWVIAWHWAFDNFILTTALPFVTCDN